jgi:undecaprenyl-diphosphatase
MSLFQIILLAVIQGAAELLPVSSSAHVIVAEKLMGLDPSSPEMTFLLVMLHTGTMFSVLFYFWPRWKGLKIDFLKMTFLATAVTGVVGLSLKAFIEKVVLSHFLGESHAEIEALFKSLPLIAFSLFSVGILILVAGWKNRSKTHDWISPPSAVLIGVVQGLCLPFRGFSRSGATISTAMLSGISKEIAEDFSFALAVVLTPPVVVRELLRYLKLLSATTPHVGLELGHAFLPGLLGMVFSFASGLIALHWLSAWIQENRWKYFGIYCILASGGVLTLHFLGF